MEIRLPMPSNIKYRRILILQLFFNLLIFYFLLQFTRRDSDGLKEGVFSKMNTKGAKLEEANYKNGKLDGQRVLFYPDGDTLIVETYEDVLTSFFICLLTCQLIFRYGKSMLMMLSFLARKAVGNAP